MATATVVLTGIPTVKVNSSEETTSRTVLTEIEQRAARVLLVRRDKKFLWVTQGNKLVSHINRGSQHLFLDPEAGNYLKIFSQPTTSGERGREYVYIEHVNQGPETVTYWGRADIFEPGS